MIQDRAFFSLSAGSRYHHLLLPVLTCGKPLFRRGSGALGLNERTDDRTYNAHVAATRPAPCLIFFLIIFFFFWLWCWGWGLRKRTLPTSVLYPRDLISNHSTAKETTIQIRSVYFVVVGRMVVLQARL